MKYFKTHPIVSYTLQNGIVSSIVDIFRKNTISLTINKFVEDVSGDNRSPETIANRVYENTELSWIIPLSNNILTQSEWFISPEEKIKELEIIYNNQLVYSINTMPDLEENDIIVETAYLDSFTTFSYVKKWNKEFRSIVALSPSGVTFLVNTPITFLRKTDESYEPISFLGMGVTMTDGITTSTDIVKATDVLDYPTQFIIGNDYISPYYGVSPGNTYIYSNILGMSGTDGFTHTILNKYNNSISATYTYLTERTSYTTETRALNLIDIIHIPTIEREYAQKLNAKNTTRSQHITV